MTDSTLRHADILGTDERIHLARAVLDRGRPSTLHAHDFYELFWVQNGRVRHHLADRTADLTEGDLLFMRPADRHALQGRGEAAMVVSITLHPALVAALPERHPRLQGHLFWSGAPDPARLHRDARHLAEINSAALQLERGARDSLAAEAFLLPLCARLIEGAGTVPADAPGWLDAACTAARDPRVFRDGAAGLARVAGRAHAHVSRTMRRYLDQSPSDFVNAQRMTHAARRLTGTSDSLTEIAADCGIPNLSHFHRLFRIHHGVTPAQYRRRHQRDVVQPQQI